MLNLLIFIVKQIQIIWHFSGSNLLEDKRTLAIAIPVNLMVFKKTQDVLFTDISKEVEVNKVLTTINNETINKVV